ncbi:MAG: class I SAM-dependent methyltransferase [Nakamurella sp.]
MSVIPRPSAVDPVADALVGLAKRVPSAVVVDIGGGSGTRAVPLAVLGCTVLVVDSSIDALAILRRRARDAGVAERITAIQADAVALSDVVPRGAADLVLCHHLLETVDDPAAAVAGIGAALKNGGIASVLVAGRFAAVLAQAVAGRFGEAAVMLNSVDGRYGPQDPLRRRYDIAGLASLLAAGGLETESISGLGVLSGLVAANQRTAGGRAGGQLDEAGLADLEAALARHGRMREIAGDLHAIARMTAG